MDNVPVPPTPSGVMPGFSAQQLALLLPMMQALNLPIPDTVADRVPEVFISPSMRDLANGFGDNLRGAGLYRRDADIVTVDEGTGKTEEMTPERFVTWAENFVLAWHLDKDKAKKYKSISSLQAKLVLSSDDFRVKIPRLAGVNMVKLPVLTKGEDGKTALRLLPQGYDAETGIFTVRGGLDYDEKMDINKAVARWKSLHQYFQWGDDGRSLAVHTAAALTVFCSAMLGKDERAPMFVYNSNSPGSGKSILVTLILLLVHGRAGVTTFWDSKEDLKKELDALAREYAPFVFFDDLMGKVQSTLLNAFLTTKTYDGRIIGGGGRFSAELRAITFMTGTGLKLRDDLGRRSLLVDLFARQAAVDRVLPPEATEITEEWIMRDEVRGELLGCLFAFVRNAHDPEGERPKDVGTARKIPSFSGWSRLIPPILLKSSFKDPTEIPNLPDAGDLDRQQREKVVDCAIREFLIAPKLSSVVVTLTQLAAIARRESCFLHVLLPVEQNLKELEDRRGGWPKCDLKKTGWVTDAFGESVWTEVEERRAPETDAERLVCAAQYMDRSQATSFGYWIRKVLGYQPFIEGRLWEFGSREEANHSAFVVRLVS